MKTPQIEALPGMTPLGIKPMTTREKIKMNWMKAYEATLLLLGHEHGKVDWDTATYLFNQGENPVKAAKGMMEKTVPSIPSEVSILKQDQVKNITLKQWNNL